MVKNWTENYEKWRDENNHLPKLQTSEQLLDRFKKQWEIRKQQQQSPENRISIVEQKLDRLMNHLGVK